jgi:hypothetical protein
MVARVRVKVMIRVKSRVGFGTVVTERLRRRYLVTLALTHFEAD